MRKLQKILILPSNYLAMLRMGMMGKDWRRKKAKRAKLLMRLQQPLKSK